MKILYFMPHLSFGGDISGHIVHALYTYKALSKHKDVTIQLATYNGVGRQTAGLKADNEYTKNLKIFNYRKSDEAKKWIEDQKFDLIVVGNPFHPSEKKTPEVFDQWLFIFQLGIPFWVYTHNEDDYEFAPVIKFAPSHEKFKGYIYSDISLKEFARDDYNSLYKDEYPIFPCICADWHLENVKTKPKLVASTSRLMYYYAVHFLVQIADELNSHGFETKSWGTYNIYQYYQQLLDIGSKSWQYMGSYGPSDVDNIHQNIMFHYNGGYLKKVSHYRKRTTKSSIEAIMHGAVPVLIPQFTPDIFKDLENCVIMDPLNPKDVVPKIVEVSNNLDLRLSIIKNATEIIRTQYMNIDYYTNQLVDKFISSVS